jgi:hypothetical protein
MNRHQKKSDMNLFGEILGEFAGVIGNWLGTILFISVCLYIFAITLCTVLVVVGFFKL